MTIRRASTCPAPGELPPNSRSEVTGGAILSEPRVVGELTTPCDSTFPVPNGPIP